MNRSWIEVRRKPIGVIHAAGTRVRSLFLISAVDEERVAVFRVARGGS